MIHQLLARYMTTILLSAMPLAMAVVAEAQWAYMTPPWNFDHHPKYDGTTPRSIPFGDWEQLAAFDSAAQCEKGRLFAREIRDLSPLNREHLLALFASGAEEQARLEAKQLLAENKEFVRRFRTVDTDPTVFDQSVRSANLKMSEWWSASKCVSTDQRRLR
jgi:hypothetical protein